MLKLFLVVELYYVSCGGLFQQCVVEVQNVPIQSVDGKAEELGEGGPCLLRNRGSCLMFLAVILHIQCLGLEISKPK